MLSSITANVPRLRCGNAQPVVMAMPCSGVLRPDAGRHLRHDNRAASCMHHYLGELANIEAACRRSIATRNKPPFSIFRRHFHAAHASCV